MAHTSAGRPGRTLIVAALPWEVRPFLRRVKAKPRRDLGFTAWDWEDESAVLALSGMGGAGARRATETLISRCRPEILVSMGFGGALVPGLAAGDVVLGETFWHYNPDTRELVAIQAPPPPRPLGQILHALNQAGLKAVTGSLVTTSRIIDKGSEGKPLSSLPQPVLDMETSVLAEVAAPRALPFLSLRAITDTASQEIPEFLRQVGDPEVTVGAREALKWLAGDLRRAKELLRLWRGSHCAARSLSKALAILVPLLFDS